MKQARAYAQTWKDPADVLPAAFCTALEGLQTRDRDFTGGEAGGDKRYSVYFQVRGERRILHVTVRRYGYTQGCLDAAQYVWRVSCRDSLLSGSGHQGFAEALRQSAANAGRYDCDLVNR